jgi:hypothetical protein
MIMQEDQAEALMEAVDMLDVGRLKMLIENCCFNPNVQDHVKILWFHYYAFLNYKFN